MKHLWLTTLLVVTLSACSDKAIRDNITRETTSEVTPGPGILVINPMDDAMDRGQHDLVKNVIVDNSYYQNNPIARGDIVYYGEKTVSRVVALPQEKMKITNGQIYINEAKLDTFYGSAHVVGADYKTFKKSFNQEPAKQNIIAEIFKKNQNEITLNNDEVFVIGDDWLRSSPSTTFRILSKKDILGKVVGICTKCTGAP